MAETSSQLILTAQVTRFVSGVEAAAKVLLRLRSVTAGVQVDVSKSLDKMGDSARKFATELAAALGGAKAPLAEVSRVATVASNDLKKVGDAAEDSAKRITGSLGRVKKETDILEAGVAKATKGAGREFKSLSDQIDGGANRIKSGLLNIRTAFLGLGVGLGLKAIIGETASFQEALSRLDVVAGDSAPIGVLRKQLLELSERTPVKLNELTLALTQIVGTLPKGADAATVGFKILDAAQKAAQASGAGIEEVALGVTAVLNTYGKTGIKAAEVTDKIFAAADQGGATIGQLSGAIGGLVGISSTFGISLNEAFGEIAVLTRAGQTGSEAITNLRQALISTARPPQIVKEKLKALGIEFGQSALASKGLIGVLEEIEAKGGKKLLSELFTDVQGFLAVSTLLSSGLKTVRKDIDGIANSAGATDKAVAKTSGNFNTAAGILKNKVAALLIDIGDKVLPKLQAAFERIGKFIEGNQSGIADSIAKVVNALISLTEFVVTNGPKILLFFGTVFAAKAINAATAAISGFGRALVASIASVGALASSGETSGASFATGFQKATSGIGKAIGSALRNPTVLGLIVSAGVLIGEALAEALTEPMDKAILKIASRVDEFSKEIDDLLKKARFKSTEDFEEKKASFQKGELISFAGGAALEGGSVFTPAEAFEQLGADIATVTKFAEDTAKRFKAEADASDKVAAGLKAQLLDAKRKVDAGGRGAIDVGATRKIADELEAERARGKAAREAAENIVGATQLEITAREARVKSIEEEAKAQKKLAGAEGGKAALARRKAIEAELAKLAEGTAQARIRAEFEALEAAKSAAAERLAEDLRVASILGTSEAGLAELKQANFKETEELATRQTQLIELVSEIEIQAVRDTAVARVAEFKDSVEVQRAIVEKAVEDEKALRSRAAIEIAEIQRAETQKFADISRELLKASFQEVADLGIFDEEPKTKEKAKGQGFLESIAKFADSAGKFFEGGSTSLIDAAQNMGEAGKAVGGVLGTLAETAGPIIGTIASIAVAIQNLPAILSGIGSFLKSGVSDFVSALAVGFEDALVGLLEGLPDQITTLLSEVVPAIIARLIGNLPKIIGGFIALIPRLVAGIVGSIPEIIQGFVDGFIEAGSQLAEFFTTDLVVKIGEGIVAVFQNIVGFFSGIFSFLFEKTFLRIFAVVVNFLFDAFKGVPGAALEFFKGIGSLIARSIGNAIKDAFSFVADKITAAFDAILQAIKDFLNFAGDTADELEGGGDSALGIIGRTVGISAAEKIITGNFEALSAKDIPLIGGLFHEGGMARGSERNHATAAAMVAAGASRFQFGGMVPPPGEAARNRLRQALKGDEIPAVLRENEAVLTPRGVRAAGGESAVEAFNRGQASGAGGMTANISILGNGIEPILGMFLRAVQVDISRPGGGTRTAIQKVGQVPLMVRAVRGRVGR